MKTLLAQRMTATLLGLTPLAAGAQGLTNDGAVITIEAGATVYVSEAVTNKASSTLTNNGRLVIGGNLTNAGSLTSGGQLVFAGSAPQELDATGATLARVRVSNSGPDGSNQLKFLANTTITDSLTLTKGMVQTPVAVTITLPNDAVLTGEGTKQYVQGNLRIERSSLAGGSATDFGHGFSLNPGTNALGAVAATRTAGLQTAGVSYGQLGSNKGIDQLWWVDAGTAPTTPVQVQLSWLADNDNGLTDFSQAQIWRGSAAAGPWVALGAPTNASSRSISGSSNALGFFTVSNLANPLPVELLSFTAERQGENGILRWTTATEKDNAHFVVEASVDGTTFRRIGQVDGHGTTAQRQDYRFKDVNVARYATELVYYRLRQVDNNGVEHLAPVRTINVPLQAFFAVQAYPNPFQNAGVGVVVRTSQTSPATLLVTDAVGRVLVSRKVTLGKGSNEVALPEAQQWSQGFYLLRVQQGPQQEVLKLIRE
ncbi:T9SS type A sorting domain-containing protein [Hymenobacter guriensis]|uniref:T9SS type A sorting domain-containing protein n=1 Tax=Hymenobacter guriensis TaxID=2793065 RepID=A0ABS0KZN2_9BACT|nr:T9SS type A sorting domain-containing protein [Hymenobacter guriensis]MBG8553330.1 T9SS type A sorting domain-containing protein [Hymenobacter guriensis]